MDEIVITEYDPNWILLFEQESARIQAVLEGDLVTRIEHFGSTAVPGLAAKPIIDLLVGVRSLVEARQIAVVPHSSWRSPALYCLSNRSTCRTSLKPSAFCTTCLRLRLIVLWCDFATHSIRAYLNLGSFENPTMTDSISVESKSSETPT
ncbi:GrpB family protein [Phormidium sp. FACHB-592]|uniref:GrpB family protein n=1 Tax=Stenomitos frigidus AS-A4 TaxID=2933935 RepID=A0ABV0KT21_9CYAN|nr:GrpB family protein [Phormidium sp. FACHB-592]